LELPPFWNDGAVARNPGVSWAFLFRAGGTQCSVPPRFLNENSLN